MADDGSQLHRIGAGFCGSVWSLDYEQYHSSDAYKREDGGPGRSLANDYHMHLQVRDAHQKWMKTYEGSAVRNISATLGQMDSQTSRIPHPPIIVPECHSFITTEDPWWDVNLGRFPKEYLPCNALRTQRIPPFPMTIRDILINAYCPSELRDEIRHSMANRDCLIRPYLGRRRITTNRISKFQAFSLRNFPLHIDQLEQMVPADHLNLYAKLMGQALSMLHWLAKVDANDVEFVLAPPPPNDTNCNGLASAVINNCLSNHVLWILDFDCCRPIEMNSRGVEQAVVAFIRNDPFFPKPTLGLKNEDPTSLWMAFKEAYIQTSSAVINLGIDLSIANLPRMVMEAVEHACTTKGVSEDRVLRHGAKLGGQTK